MIPYSLDQQRGEPAFGSIENNHPAFARYQADLAAVTAKGYARFPVPS
jgi:hypothetical protein